MRTTTVGDASELLRVAQHLVARRWFKYYNVHLDFSLMHSMLTLSHILEGLRDDKPIRSTRGFSLMRFTAAKRGRADGFSVFHAGATVISADF
ncbi:hypothetical protein MRX96_011643 [Rhipicephalus microplus]